MTLRPTHGPPCRHVQGIRAGGYQWSPPARDSRRESAPHAAPHDHSATARVVPRCLMSPKRRLHLHRPQGQRPDLSNAHCPYEAI